MCIFLSNNKKVGFTFDVPRKESNCQIFCPIKIECYMEDNIQDKIDILPHSLHIWYEFTEPVTEFCDWLLENVYLMKGFQD